MNENELYHHGVLGQKWGVRRYQNADGTYTAAGRARYGVGNARTAKQYQNRLNDLDKAMSFHKKSQNEALLTRQGITDYKKKKGEFEQQDDGYTIKFKDTKRDQKIANRFLNAGKKYDEAQEWINKGQKETQKIIKDLEKNGYKVDSKNVTRIAMKGKDYAQIALADVGIAGLVIGATALSGGALLPATKGAAIGGAIGTSKALNMYKTDGKKHKVSQKRNNSNNSNNSNNTSSKSSINEKLKAAKEHDRYSLDFLEVAPEHLVSKGGPQLLKQYEQYLNNPSEYLKNR